VYSLALALASMVLARGFGRVTNREVQDFVNARSTANQEKKKLDI
jgi:hypothetical protein